jgi:NADPH:quinone reductase-like Zn-dependent oxidoreductase
LEGEVGKRPTARVGTVTANSCAATGFKTGDGVFFHAEFVRGGSYAEYVAVDASQVSLKPRTVPLAAAAAHGRRADPVGLLVDARIHYR